MAMKFATFGAGCFWGVEVTFRNHPGVSEAFVGYMGGESENPTYEQVCTGTTNHAEVVQVSYDPENVTYDELLREFWACHDPTTLNSQGPDHGTQYRSVIFCHDAEQKAEAIESMMLEEDSERNENTIVTEITEAGAFWKGEEYHQKFLEKKGLVSNDFE